MIHKNIHTGDHGITKLMYNISIFYIENLITY